MIIALKWIYKVKLDEYDDVLKNKARLSAHEHIHKNITKRAVRISTPATCYFRLQPAFQSEERMSSKRQLFLTTDSDKLRYDQKCKNMKRSQDMQLIQKLRNDQKRQVTIQTEFFFNKDLEYLRFGNKGDRLALSITKIKAAHYPDAGLEQMVPDQMWIEEECMYDISATYGISHWWFKRQKFYIERHSANTNRRAIVKTHMRILSVVRIEVLLIYGYDYMKKIILQRADNQEYTIAENDFKDLYPSDFEDLYLLNLQGHLNHLPPRDKKILSTAINLWIRNLEATGLKFMHDYKILDSSRAVLFRDKYGMQMLMRFNEVHKFSDGTLQQIDEALDYRVKEFKVNKNNSGLNTSSGESSGTWKALLVEEYAKETTDFYEEPNDDIFFVASRTSCVGRECDLNIKSDKMLSIKTQVGSPPSMCQTISNIDAHVKGEQFHKSKQSRYSFPQSCQSRRDLPRDNPLVSVEVLRNPDGSSCWQETRLFTTPCSHFIFLIQNIMIKKMTYNIASATLMLAIMIQKSVSMPVRRSQPHKEAILLNKDD
ncbi:hypothetical protein Tco_1237999 [Tanacetum coccineum]